MKKIIFIVALLFGINLSLFAQLKEGDGMLGPSLGLWTAPQSPTFGLNYEYQMAQLGDVSTISLGGVFRYSTFRDNPTPNYYNYNYLTLGLQSNLNFNTIANGRFVPFVGLVLGYNYVNSNYYTNDGTVYSAGYTSGLWLWGQFGMRYFFSQRVAGSLRFGAGNFNFNVLELGIDFKL